MKNFFLFKNKESIPNSFILIFNDFLVLEKYLNDILKKIFNDKIKKFSFDQLKNNYFSNIKFIGNFNYDIKKETILEIINDSNYSTYNNLNKVYIINGFNQLSNNAKHSLLIWLENLPKNIYILFLLKNELEILPSIKSRMQIFKINNLLDLKKDFKNKDLILDFFNKIIQNKLEEIVLLEDKLEKLTRLELFNFFKKLVDILILKGWNNYKILKNILFNLKYFKQEPHINKKLLILLIVLEFYKKD